MKKNTFWGIAVAIVGLGCGLWLLVDLESISGTEFVALSLGFSVIGLIIVFSSEVQEFSIPGNGVKLKELRSEAEKTIEELKQARNELFRILVQKSIDGSGEFGDSSKVESRAKNFIHIFNEIEKINAVKELKLDLKTSLKIIMRAQYNNLSFIHHTQKAFDEDFTALDEAHFLYIALNDDVIKNSYKNRSSEPNFQTEKEDIINAIEVYSKLYAIKLKLDHI